MCYSAWIGRHRAKNAWSGKFIGLASTYKRCYKYNSTIFVTEDTRCYQVLVIRPDVVSIQARLWADKWVYIGLTSGLDRAYIGSKSGKKYIAGLYLLTFVSTSLNKRALLYIFPRDVVCLSGGGGGGSFVCVSLLIKRRWKTINRGTLTNIADVPREKSRRTCVLFPILPDTPHQPIHPRHTQN